MGKTPTDPSAAIDPLGGLLEKTGLWRASRLGTGYGASYDKKLCSTGFPRLDAELPGSGWPSDGVTEFLHDSVGIGEFRLLTPALARITHEQTRWVLFVSPPYIPYPPALAQAGVDLTRVIVSQPRASKDYLWVLEKALASQSCSAVIAWPGKIQEKQVRRLQLASKEGDAWGILFRPTSAAANASPAELRIRLRPVSRQFAQGDTSALSVRVLKRRGRWESEEFILTFGDELFRPMPDFSEMIVEQSLPKDLPEPESHRVDRPLIQPLHEHQ